MRAAVYNLYWDTFGGGEQVAGTIAEELSRSHEVDLLGPRDVPVDALKRRLGVDVSRCRWRQVNDDAEASTASADYDLFVNTTYLSGARNRSPAGLYYVHFPGVPPSRRDLAKAPVAERVIGLVDRSPVQPRRLSALRARVEPWRRDSSFAGSYHNVAANSAFTASWVERLWGVTSSVMFPPVRPLPSSSPKREVIASVGRFFDPSKGHSKKQADLVRAFGRLHRGGWAPDWELHLVGGCDVANRESLNEVRRLAIGLPVVVHLNAPGERLLDVIGHASLYWHGGGFGEDPMTHPERFEHFGIAVVEAMSAGAVPIVFGAAGPAEIVRARIDGRHWHTPDELIAATEELIAHPTAQASAREHARERAAEFSTQRFAERLSAAVEAIC